MNLPRSVVRWVLILGVAGAAQAQAPQEEFKPVSGQPGKDVVWVPTPQLVTDKMLDVAKVTPQDYVVDLGSGDGRNIISAAKRGARGRGVEYNPNMVALSRRNAAQEGVADRALFVEGDMFAADFSDATVLALFLLPDNLNRLRDKFLALKPGTRIVANTFWIDGWDPDEEVKLWKRMAKLSGSQPEIISTHPDPERRAEDLQKEQSDVRSIYNASKKMPSTKIPAA